MSAEAKTRVLVAMSGGVDSSVAAYLLKKAGYEVIGITFSVYDYSRLNRDQGKGSCCSLEDVDDARLVCDHLGIRHYLVDSREAFKKQVIDYFAKSYREGKTPNPCMACNTFIKFDELSYHAKLLGAELYATGHYVRKAYEEDRFYFETAADEQKDQSYFLLGVSQDFLSKAIFPLHGMTKEEIRRIALEQKLPVSRKPESMEVCFVPKNDYREFLKAEYKMEDRPGKIVNQSGEVLGEHSGIHHFTLGQRRGLGAFGPKASYVVELRAKTNEVVVGENPALFSEGVLFAPDFFPEAQRWLGERLFVKIRSRSDRIPAVLEETTEGLIGRFDVAQRAITPGQFAVFYEPLADGHYRLVGGGPILRGWNTASNSVEENKFSQTGS